MIIKVPANAYEINDLALLVVEYQQRTGLKAIHNVIMHRVQIEHPQPGVSHPEAWLSVPAQQFIDNFEIYVSGQLPD